MGVLIPRSAAAIARTAVTVCLLVLASLGTGCRSEEGGPGRYAARGIVEDVDVEGRQVLIDHEDVEGLMPAMTMNFVVPDADVLAQLAPGQLIEFEIEFTGRSYDVVATKVVGQAPAEDGWRALRGGLVRSSEAPDFSLIDQAGRNVTLGDFEDRVLLVDFIYTSCPGPCPVQTSNQVALQKKIPQSIREKVHFLSISLDPVVDQPAVLERYATSRGADLSSWSFLTGPEQAMAEVVRSWGVGSLRKSDGTIDHTLLTFLVRNGRVFERYSPADVGDPKILAAIVDLAERREEADAAPAASAAPTR